MTLWQCILLGFVFYLWAVRPGYTVRFDRPIIIVVLVGIIMGDVPTAMKVGAAIQPIYLAFTGAGGTIVADVPAATIIPACLAITTGLSVEQGTALAVPLGLLVAQLHTVRRIVASAWVHMGDKAAARGDVKGILMAGLVYPNLLKIVMFWLPMTLILYYGLNSVGAVVEGMPQWLKNGLSVTGKLMPAMGFGMTLMQIGRRDLQPYFFAGFFFAKYSGLGNMPLACMALFLAFLDMRFARRDEVDANAEAESDMAQQELQGKHLLTKKDVRKTWWLWWFSIEQSSGFERLQALAFCVTMAPILHKLHRDNPEELKASLQRHLLFFNTEGIVGSVILGVVISMEEQRAMGVNVPTSAITGVKSGLMGPIAGIGDTITKSMFLPLLLAFFVPYAAEGHWWAGVLPFVIYLVVTCALGLYFVFMGYNLGTRAAVTLLQSGQVQRIITFFSVMGLFMIGALAASMVVVETGISIPTSGEPMSLQADILDAILPGMLSILSVYGTYAYLKGKGTALRCTLLLILAGMVLGGLGILA